MSALGFLLKSRHVIKFGFPTLISVRACEWLPQNGTDNDFIFTY